MGIWKGAITFSAFYAQIFIWQFKDKKELLGIAFIDAEVHMHSAKALKNFILIADIHRSVQLLRYQVLCI